MNRIQSEPSACVGYSLPESPGCGRTLRGEDARLWRGLERLVHEAPSVMTVLADIVREGMKPLDDRVTSWCLQTGTFVPDPEVLPGKPAYKLHWVARDFVLATRSKAYAL